MRETLQEKLQKFNLLADTDIFHNLLGNASSVLFSKTHEYEHSGALMKNPIGYFTRTFKQMVYNYIDSFKDIHNFANRKASACTNSRIFYNWLEVDGSKFLLQLPWTTLWRPVYITTFLGRSQ